MKRLAKIEALMEEFLLGMPNKCTRANYQSDIRSLNAYFRPWKGNETRMQVIRYIRHLEALKLKPTTIRERTTRLVKIYRFLANNDFRKDIPVELSMAPKMRIMTAPKSPNIIQIKNLIKNLTSYSNEGLRDSTMVGLMLFEGLRVSEVSKLRLSDIEEVIRGK